MILLVERESYVLEEIRNPGVTACTRMWTVIDDVSKSGREAWSWRRLAMLLGNVLPQVGEICAHVAEKIDLWKGNYFPRTMISVDGLD